MRIKKTSQYIEGGASLSTTYGTSNSDGYTQSYINGINTYSTDEVDTGQTWINGEKIYCKVVPFTVSSTSSNYINVDLGVSTSYSIIQPLKICKKDEGYDIAWFGRTQIDMYTSTSSGTRRFSFKPSQNDCVGNWYITVFYIKTTS